MVPLHSRIKSWNDHLFGSQEPDLFPDSTEVESQTSAMVTSVTGIWHQVNPFTRRQNDLVRYPFSMTWLHTRQRHWQWRYDPPTRQIIQTDIINYSFNRHRPSTENCEFGRPWHRSDTVMHQLMLHWNLKIKRKFLAFHFFNKNYVIILYNSITSFSQNFGWFCPLLVK